MAERVTHAVDARCDFPDGGCDDDLARFLLVLDQLDASMQAIFRRVEKELAEQAQQRKEAADGLRR